MQLAKMNARIILQVPVWLLAGCGALLNAQPNAAEGITAVCSRVSKDYVRTKLPDGSFRPEEYVLVKGGRLDGPVRDPSFDDSTFLKVARSIVGPLAAQSYRPAKKLDTEKLLIVVYWGTTSVPDAMAMSPASVGLHNEITAKTDIQDLGQLYTDDIMRNQIDKENAALLGYDSDVSVGGGISVNTGMARDWHNEELVSELEDSRYFVVLFAFDFEAFRTKKEHKLLWETRFSIQEARNFFDKALPVMAQYASPYFGRDSHGLVRTKVPEGKVLIGEPRALDVVEAPLK